MPPLSFTLRHSAATFDWELAVAGDSAASHHATHSSAFDMLSTHPQLFARGAIVRVFGADGGYECERTYAAAGAGSDVVAAGASAVAL